MFTLFGILTPATDRSVARDEAPFKKSFFGGTVETSATLSAIEEEALYLGGKRPEPDERPTTWPGPQACL